MKKASLIFAISLCTTFAAYSQTNALNTSGNVGIETTNPTNSLTIGSAGSGVAIYNTSEPYTTDYERFIAAWASNVFQLRANSSGNGTTRAIAMGIGGTSLSRSITVANASSQSGVLRFDYGSISSATSGIGMFGTFSASTAVVQNAYAVVPTVNQTSGVAAGYRALWVSPYESSLGTGMHLLIDAGTNGLAAGAGVHTSKFTVDNTGAGYFAGNVSVGASIAAQPLTIAGSGATSSAFLRSIAGGNASLGMALGQNFFGAYNSTTGSEIQTARIRAIATQNWAVGSRGTALGFGVVANGTTTLNEAFYIDQNGKVGIGTTAPVSALTLGGTGNANPNTGAEVDYAGESLTFLSQAPGQAFTLGGIKMVQPNSTYIDRGDMVFSLGTGSGAVAERMRITPDGFVGIGTATPREALSVNGNIRSKEVKVELTNWPDYVFMPAYKLPTLGEVKNYIDKNQHLPGLPSAKEVEADGLSLGEINKQLTKKVEELTLYLIDAERFNKEQSKKQEQRIKALEEKLNLILKKTQ